ncbi:putative vinorine synthase [Helianthus annuus]|nr:putative vinorine synthase [Helianthus annuus]KAJ0812616.1 putative vinorine synthase [Helianthus annuus]
MMKINIEKHSSKFIKPLVPTPSTLRYYKISFFDELAPSMDIGVVLFFSKNNNDLNIKFVTQLEQSLEKTLPQFYPLAGRYVNETYTVDCNDDGVEFIHAKVNIKLQDVIANEKNSKLVDKFIPPKTGEANLLLAIQATMFECGGVALGVRAAHRIVDASTLCTFLSEWATMNREEHIEITGPGFNTSSLFPGRCFPPGPLQPISDDDMSTKYIRKLYSFSESAISNMKVKANTSTCHHHWSKVQLVSAVIWNALIGVDRANNNPRESVLVQPVNLRGKTASLIPKHSCGNLCVFCATEAGVIETTKELANRLTNNVKEMIHNFSKVDHNSEEGQLRVLNSLSLPNIRESTNLITISSWCKFPFYGIDFGLGTPTWIAPWSMPMVNTTCLMDEARGNGVDAHVFIEVKDVPYFEEALRLQVGSFAA